MFATMKNQDKPLVLLHGEIKTPPFSSSARIEGGFLFRILQMGESCIQGRCQALERIATSLRINDKNCTWRIIYRTDNDAIIILEVFNKKTQQTPKKIIDVCKKRIKEYDNE